MNTKQKQILAAIPQPPDGAVFSLRKIDTVVLPHPYVIGNGHIKHSTGGTLNIDEAERNGVYCYECKKPNSEHTPQVTLFIRVPQNRDLNAVPGLGEYLSAIKDTATAAGVQGFAFPDKDPWKDTTARIVSGDGAGCFLDPPSYPTHTHSVRTGKGRDSGIMSLESALEDDQAEHLPDAVLARVRGLIDGWHATKPAIDSPRVIAWMKACYGHLNKCYRDAEQVAEPFEHGKPATIIFPVPYYKLRSFHDDPRFSEEWRTGQREQIERENNEKRALYAKVATPDNHQAVLHIRKYYPEHTPNLEWIANAPAAA